MSSADLLSAARTILGVLGVALAKPVDATGLAMPQVLRGLPGDAARWGDRLAADLTQDLARLNLPAQTRLLIPRMLVAADLAPAQIIAAGDPARITALMLARLDDPAHKVPKVRDGFARVVTGLLTRLVGDPETAVLRPAFDAAIAAALDHLATHAASLADRARDDARRLGVPEDMLLSLARRHAPADPASPDPAFRNLAAALETAARIRHYRESPTR